MIKKIFILFIFFILSFYLGSIDKTEEKDLKILKETALISDSIKDKVKKYDRIYLDIGTNNDGYYSLVGEAEIHQDEENNINSIYINNPILLAFSVSSEHNGGVWIVDLDEGEKMIKNLEEVSYELKASENKELYEKIMESIQILKNSGPFTKTST